MKKFLPVFMWRGGKCSVVDTGSILLMIIIITSTNDCVAISFLLATSTKEKTGGFQSQLTFQDLFLCPFLMPEDGILEGLGKAGGRKLQVGQEQATRGLAMWQDLFLLSKGLFVSLQHR